MPPSQWQTYRQRDFTGGENLSDLPERIGRNQFVKMENAVISPEGWVTDSFKTDQPFATNNVTAVGIDGSMVISPYMGYGEDANVFAGFWDSGGNIAYGYFSGDTMEFVGVAIEALDGYSINGLSFAVPFLGKYYTVNRLGGLIDLTINEFPKITGGGLDGKTPIKLRRYANRLWIINNDGSLQCSDNGNASTWNALNIMFLPDQDKMIDFFPVQGGAIVHSRTAIYPMYGSDYTDITFGTGSGQPMIDNIRIAASVRAENYVYFLTDQGIYRGGMNGVELLPHDQHSFLKANWIWFFGGNFFADDAEVSSIYLKRFDALMFLCKTGSGTQGFMYYLKTNAWTKINATLPANYPYILATNMPGADFLITNDVGDICKSTYQSGPLPAQRTTTIQTRHEDADSQRDKVWREFILDMEMPAYIVSIYAILDYGELMLIDDTMDLEQGPNRIPLFDQDGNSMRSKTISLKIVIQPTPGAIKDENNKRFLRDGTNLLTDGWTALSDPASFAIKSMSLKYRETGPVS